MEKLTEEEAYRRNKVCKDKWRKNNPVKAKHEFEI